MTIRFVRLLTLSLMAPLAMPSLSLAGGNGTYSERPYVRADGWRWEPETGMWRNPREVIDPATGRLSVQRQHPSSTMCCDDTGLWMPEGAVNRDDFGYKVDPASKKGRGARKAGNSRQAAPAAEDPNSLEAQIGVIRRNGRPAAEQERMIAALRAARDGTSLDNLGPVEGAAVATPPVEYRERAPSESVRYGYVEGERPSESYRGTPPTEDLHERYMRSANSSGALNDGTLVPRGRYEERVESSDSGSSALGSAASGLGDVVTGVLGVATAVAPAALGAASALSNRGVSTSTPSYSAPPTIVRQAPQPSTIRAMPDNPIRSGISGR